LQEARTGAERAIATLLQRIFGSNPHNHPRLSKYTAMVNRDLAATYSRDIYKWLLLSPIIGVATGLFIALLNLVILDKIWAKVLPAYMANHWMIVPGLLIGFLLTGLIMQFGAPNPNEHTTEEIISSYHNREGYIDMRSFWWKFLAAVTTIGSGGSAALEGPSIYGGGAIGSWLWTRLRRFGLEPRDRRIMLISGAGAGMAAVFRAPLTGLVFALEVPYKDDLAHEALLPSLIAAVVSYSTLAVIVGSEPLFGFVGTINFAPIDLLWSAILGLGVGLVAMVFDLTFRRVRAFFVANSMPHTVKLMIGGLGTGLCGLAFVSIYHIGLIPIGPNYYAVHEVLRKPYPAQALAVFALLKMIGAIFSVGSGGVSAVFVPLVLTGGCLGSAFAQSIVHAHTVDLYAAVGMAAFIAAGYKTPLTAVIFVAETTNGHSFIIPSLIGAAIAYAVSGEASVSGDQLLHELAKIPALVKVQARDVMQKQVISAQADASLSDFAASAAMHRQHSVFPVQRDEQIVGVVSVSDLTRVPPDQWETTSVDTITDHSPVRVPEDCDLMEALRLLLHDRAAQMLLVEAPDGKLAGLVTKTDVLRAVDNTRGISSERVEPETTKPA
jgi:CIC family chloride channel protein